MASSLCYKEVVPFMGMVSVECTSVGLHTLFKVATSGGMSYYVFFLYAYAFSTLVLLPLSCIFLRKTVLPPLNLSIISRIFLLGLIGLSAQMIGYKGLDYSTPTLSSAMSNLIAAFTFILAVVFRMEKLTLRSWRTCAKVLGTIVSISGAFIVVLYKGPNIFSTAPSKSFNDQSLSWSQTKWVVGGILLATQCLLLSCWNILQAHIMRIYPAEVFVSFLYTLTVATVSAPICLLSERNPSSWRLRPDIATLTVVYAGFFGPSYSTALHFWGARLKGPVYIAIFKPLSIVIAAAMGFVFLGDALTLGSVVGAIVISVGFYAVIWGKAREDMSEEHGFGSITSLPSSATFKTPLLQSQNVDVNTCK